ncbi:hypothetical protein L228DRAFT_243608 [Xylona heveae TC161]|uniref:ABC1 atypical kinase-like domain-containing protein n=1 Tax=Xylona heveae (strain CBS 132557 / TC161) TaxID=1328760 RepID=A0A165IGP5_XYLHT|nr:hypothetical protein L228DRAFT_243608 [Xylona heveae TC161]KZF24869.1 hypothetical protein L228DRAFT_243608 [Xylona heveae TC161]
MPFSLKGTEKPKPPIPYVIGWKFTAYSHIPPPPTPMTYDCSSHASFRHEREQTDPVELCLRHPPLPGGCRSDEGDTGNTTSVELQIRGILRAGNKHSAQLVFVDVLRAAVDDDQHYPGLGGLAGTKGQGQRLVAKFYDPLYVDDEGGFLDAFSIADRHYTHETRTYIELADLQGKSIPRYYGSFSVDICVGSSLSSSCSVAAVASSSSSSLSSRRTTKMTRPVRFILIEYLPGTTMMNADPAAYSQQTRQHIMKAVVDFDTAIYARNIMNADLHPRNIILVDGQESQDSNAPPHLVFIDFGFAIFGRTWDGSDERRPHKMFSGIYISPLLLWHESRRSRFDFEEWVDWNWQRWLNAEYKHTASSITKEMRKTYLH